MSKNRSMSAIVVGLGLILLGGLFLLNNLRMLPVPLERQEWFWISLFGVVGLGFLWTFFSDPKVRWWAVIPSFTMLGLTFLMGGTLTHLLPEGGELGGALFLGMIGLSFWVILLVTPENWWAMIPGGVLLTLTAVIATSGYRYANEALPGAVFFLGLAATFGIVSLRRVNGVRLTWALWPAGVLAVMGFVLLVSVTSLVSWVWGAALIAVGLFLTVRSLKK